MAYEDDKTYLVKGSALNRIDRELATLRPIQGEGIGLRRIPGTGTEIRYDPLGGAPPKQWQLRHTTESETGAQIRSGTLTGLGLDGYLGSWDADTWYDVTMDRQIWLKLTVEVSGAPYIYASSATTMDTVWLPSHVSDSSAELHYTALGVDAPASATPTVDPDGGGPVSPGVYYFRIGAVSAAAAINDYIGPLGIHWCPPDSPSLVALVS